MDNKEIESKIIEAIDTLLQEKSCRLITGYWFGGRNSYCALGAFYLKNVEPPHITTNIYDIASSLGVDVNWVNSFTSAFDEADPISSVSNKEAFNMGERIRNKYIKELS